jgi:hypothetical protein
MLLRPWRDDRPVGLILSMTRLVSLLQSRS